VDEGQFRGRAVVVDSEPAAGVEKLQAGAGFRQLDVDSTRFSHRILDRPHGGDLGTDVEVHHLEAVEHLRLAQPIHQHHDLGRRESELRSVTRGFHPLAGALGRELRTNADVGPDAEPPRGLQQQLELPVPIDHDDRVAPETLRQERRLHVLGVFVSVQHQQSVGVVEQCQPDEQLRLGASLESEPVGEAEAHELFDDLMLLVDLDRIDATVTALVAVLADRELEATEQRAETAVEDVREANQQRQVEPAALQIEHQIEQIDPPAFGTRGCRFHVTGIVDGEVTARPSGDVVQQRRLFGRPRTNFLQESSSLPSLSPRCGSNSHERRERRERRPPVKSPVALAP
jgi:hypothetical protein